MGRIGRYYVEVIGCVGEGGKEGKGGRGGGTEWEAGERFCGRDEM